jgi:hypothetical protein
MPACPYGNHRLVIGSNAACERRGNDLRVYAALEQMPLAFYNRVRRQWDAGDLAGGDFLANGLRYRGAPSEPS